MKNKISLNSSDKIHLKLNGSFDIKVFESEGFIGVEYEIDSNKSCSIKEEPGGVIFFDADKESSDWNHDFNDSISKLDFKNGFVNFLDSTKPLIQAILNRKKSLKVDLSLFLKKGETKKLVINADNVNIDFGKTCIQQLSIDADNCHIKSNSDFIVSKVDVHSDNLEASIHFGKQAPFWNISSDNASVRIIRTKGFDGQIRISGDNKDVSGRTKGDSSIGVCEIRADNADVDING